jgi:hypothetical protein
MPDLRHKLEAFEAQMARYEQATSMIGTLMMMVAAVSLALLLDLLLGQEWSPKDLAGFIP